MIGWQKNRDCDITMPLSLKTMKVQIKAKETNEIRGLERCRSTGKFKGISGIVKKYSLKTDPVALTKKINFEVQKHSKTFARRLLIGSAYICCFLLVWEVIGE